MAIDPVPAFPFPRRPFSSITPFTYSDAMTHLELLEKLRVYAGVTLPAEINKVLDEYSVEITAEVQAAIDLMIGTLNDKIVEINDALADQQADYTQKISDLTAYVDDAVQQIINNSIEVQDPVVAGLINDASSATAIALDQTLDGYVAKDSLVYNAADHGVIGSGTSNDTATMQALIDSVPDGATIVAPPGAIYRSDGWVAKNRSINLDLSNAHLIKNSAENPILTMEGSFDDVVPGVGFGTNQRYSYLTVTNPLAFSRGDIVKVFSDDEIKDTRPRNATEKSWQGEFAVVHAVSGSEIHVMPPLLDNYVTNVRVARIQNHAVNFKFGTADFDHPATAEFSGGMFRIRAMNGASLEGHVLRGPGSAVGEGSSVYTKINLRVENLPPADGYGVVCTGSSWGEYNIVANRLRHAFTDDASGRHPIGQTDPLRFGRSMYARITGSSGGTTRVPWDTHHGGYGHHFHDIVATGTDARWLFRIRGRGHTLSNCIAIGAESGFGIMEESGIPGGAETNGHRFVNCATYRVGQPFNVAKFTHVNPDIDSVTVEGGRFEFFRQGPTIEYGSIRMVDPVLIFTEGPYTHEGTAFFNIVNGRLEGSMTLLAQHIGSGDSPRFIFRGSTGGPGTNNIDVNAKIKLSPSARHEIEAVMQWNSTRGQVTADIEGNHTILPAWDITEDAATQQSTVINTLSNSAYTSNWRNSSVNSGGMIKVGSRDMVLSTRLSADSAVTVSGIEPGAVAGQRLTLYYIGSGSVTIPSHGSANTSIGGGDRTLNSRESIDLIWDRSSGLWVGL